MIMSSKIIVYHVNDLMCILNISHNEAYALMHCKSFPSMVLGSTWLVKKDLFDIWYNSDEGQNYLKSLYDRRRNSRNF